MRDTMVVESHDVEFGRETLRLCGHPGEELFEEIRRRNNFLERDLLDRLAALKFDSGLILDVGASLGNHTVFLANAFPHLDLVAVEPSTANVELLRHNVRSNDLADRVKIVTHPWGADEGDRAAATATEVRKPRTRRSAASNTQSPMRATMDEFVAGRKACLLRIDASADAAAVLRGGLQTVRTHHPVVVTGDDPSMRDEIAAILVPLGYTSVTVGSAGDNLMWLAPGAVIHPAEMSEMESRNTDSSAAGGAAVCDGLTPLAEEVVWRESVDARLAALVANQQESAEAVKCWQGAYRSLSRLTGDLAPEVWTHIPLENEQDAARPRDVTRRKTRDPVRIGIATMPGREQGLMDVLGALHSQADEIFVYLNGYDRPPAGMPDYENVTFVTGVDIGDRGKFAFLEGFEGYFLTCDDDILYPKFYVDHIIAGIERHGRQRVVAWHGCVIREPFHNYYDAGSRRVFAYYTDRGHDSPVHLVGTGATGFHTSTINFSMDDMRRANMADVWFAIRAREQGVGLVVLAHEKGWAVPIDRAAPSISNSSLGRDVEDTMLDMRAIVTDEVKSHAPWPALERPTRPPRPEVRLGIIGRTDRALRKKGGILKSCHLMAETLRRFGAQTAMADIDTGDPIGFDGFSPNVVLIYVGDPNRPDYAKVDDCISYHAGQGRPVVVNMSLEGHAERSRWIRDRLALWRSRFPGMVYGMVFTNAARQLEEFRDVRDQVLVIPKTLEELAPVAATFGTTRGVFVGDIAKLSEPEIIDGDVHEWLSAIRRAVPGEPIFGVKQYAPRQKVDLDIDEIWPFMRVEMSAKLASVRTMVSLAANATFEMVPVEVASLGVPVVHRVMPQSLSEYFGVSALEVQTPEELTAVLPELYANPIVWRSFSEAGRYRARSLRLSATAGYFYLQLLRLTKRTTTA